MAVEILENFSTKSCCVIDCGLFVEVAVTMARAGFGKVYYYSPWESAFPRSNSMLIGTGLDGVERVDDIWSILDNVDLFIFPDVYFGGLQEHLVSLGKRVWGSKHGEELELFRDKSKEHLQELGFKIGPYRLIKGIDRLREHLKEHKNQYVKISRTRGDMESFHSPNYGLIMPRLDMLEHDLGAKKQVMQFIVEDAIDDAVEVGYDAYTIDGKFPAQGMVGIEAKDKGYVGHFVRYDDMPKQIIETNARIAPTLESYKYRNFMALEMRIARDGTPYVIDPCARMSSPCGELMQIMYKNLASVFWHGAEGVLVDPVPAGEWGVEVMIHSSFADKNWQAIEFPKRFRENLKFRNLTVIEGKYYVVPQSVGLPEIGAAVAVGETLDAAIEEVNEILDSVKGYYIEAFPSALDDIQGEIEKLKTFGIRF